MTLNYLLNELTLFLGGVIYGRHVTYKRSVTYDWKNMVPSTL